MKKQVKSEGTQRSYRSAKQNSRMTQPLVTVVMPVYNAVNYLEEAIESIRNQTYTHFELLVVDDLSTDGSYELAQKIARKDRRIRVYRNGKHRGVASMGNYMIAKVKGRFVARMDADDVALPDRLALQVKYLTTHPDVVAVGGQCEVIDSQGSVTGEKRFPTAYEAVYTMMFSSIPLQQPTLMVDRHNLPADFVWYEEGLRSAEEVELLFKFFNYGKVENLTETVLQYRVHGKNVSLKNPRKTFYMTLRARWKGVQVHGYKPTLKGVGVTVTQTVVVTLLPSAWIYPVYAWVRGVKGASLKVHGESRRILARLFA